MNLKWNIFFQVAANPDNHCTNPGLERVVQILSEDSTADLEDTVDTIIGSESVSESSRPNKGRKLGDRSRARGKLFVCDSMSTAEQVSSSTQPQREDDVYLANSQKASLQPERDALSPAQLRALFRRTQSKFRGIRSQAQDFEENQ